MLLFSSVILFSVYVLGQTEKIYNPEANIPMSEKEKSYASKLK